LTWNGQEDSGVLLSGGVSFVMLDAGNKRTIKKLVFLGADE
jgi:hypothetical protein